MPTVLGERNANDLEMTANGLDEIQGSIAFFCAENGN
jgi:hypothetical protein